MVADTKKEKEKERTRVFNCVSLLLTISSYLPLQSPPSDTYRRRDGDKEEEEEKEVVDDQKTERTEAQTGIGPFFIVAVQQQQQLLFHSSMDSIVVL